MSDRTIYTAVCERDKDSRVWVVTIAELPGVITQARNLIDARRLARDAIALSLDVDESTIDVAIEARVEDRAQSVASRADDARAAADTARTEASARLRDAVKMLVEDQGLTLRDAAEILGISYQRVAQVAPARTTVARK